MLHTASSGKLYIVLLLGLTQFDMEFAAWMSEFKSLQSSTRATGPSIHVVLLSELLLA